MKNEVDSNKSITLKYIELLTQNFDSRSQPNLGPRWVRNTDRRQGRRNNQCLQVILVIKFQVYRISLNFGQSKYIGNDVVTLKWYIGKLMIDNLLLMTN